MAFQGDSIFWVEVEKIVPNPFQPRREFDEDKLKELAESVRMYGILQPLTVTRREIQNEDGSFRSEYELIAGERRLRASKLAGVAQVPVIIREGEQSEQEKLELAIIENLQREDLNAVDRAIAFRQLADVFGLSHALVAKKMGRSREYVSNSIRLLALPDYMLSALRTGDISEGHARALLMLNDRPEEQDTVFRELLLKKLSVREVERIARHIATEKIRKKSDHDPDLIEMEKKFTETLGTRVSITKTDFGGRLSIDYFTQDELEEILEGMRREAIKIVSPRPVEVNTTESEAPNLSLGQPLMQALDNPRADELAILTNWIGLELVPEATSIVPVIPVPAATVDVYVAEPVYFASSAVDVTAESPEIAVGTAAAEVPVPFVAVSTEAAPLEIKAEPTVVPTSEPIRAKLSLRDQLALLLNKNVPTVPIVAAAAAVPGFEALAQNQSASQDTLVSTTDTTEVRLIVPDVPKDTPDESDLYSIRDFSI